MFRGAQRAARGSSEDVQRRSEDVQRTLRERSEAAQGGVCALPNSRCIETWAREGVYLGSQLPVDAGPGKTRQNWAKPGASLDRSNG